MNERIKELSLQASDSIPDDVSAEHAMYLFQTKFAELIVRECIGVVYNERGTDRGSDRDFTIVNIALKIDRHFGVEE